MAYATYNDLLLELDKLTLIRLTDDEDIGEVNQEICELMLEKASARIDGKIGTRITIPFSTPPDGVLKGWCLDMAIYYLFGRRQEAPGIVWEDRYSRVEADLDKVALGKMTFGSGDPEGTGNRQPMLYTSRTKVFGRFTL